MKNDSIGTILLKNSASWGHINEEWYKWGYVRTNLIEAIIVRNELFGIY